VYSTAIPRPSIAPPFVTLFAPLARVGLAWQRAVGAMRRSPDAPESTRICSSAAPPSPSRGAGARPSDGPNDGTGPVEVDELVRRSRSGDRMAFAELYRTHREIVARLVFRMLGRASDVEDVVQEVFLQVHKSLGDFRGQSKFSTWLHRITVNVVLMIRRAERSRPVFADEPLVGEKETDAGLLPDEEATRRRRIAAFKRLLDRLSEKKRTVYVLHDIEGLPPAEIAAIVEAPVLTVRTRLFYARRELAEMMREEPSLSQLEDELAAEGARVEDDNRRLSPAETEGT
jgi:RNA polymerase sigma factor (sigma-70 family)